MIPNQEPIIHVGIQLSESIEFKLNGNFRLGNELIVEGTYTAVTLNNCVKTTFAKSAQIELQPEENSTFELCNVTIGIGFHWEQKENQEFEGGLTLQIEDGKIRVINAIPLEKYLTSVISSEMSAMNDETLLKVHAIVSRSWLLAQLQNKKIITENSYSEKINSEGIKEITKWYDREDHQTFDVCADDHCQRYQGITKIISKNAQKAIDATRGKVLIYNNEICDTRFSKCCGGITESFENAWQPVHIPYLSNIRDFNSNSELKIDEQFFRSSPPAFCNTADANILKQVLIDFDQSTTNFYRWNIEYSQSELSLLLRKKSGYDFGQIIDLVPLKRGESGRITHLKIIGSQQSIIIGKELEIRKWLSESHLYSSAFVVEKEIAANKTAPSLFRLIGAGWGHGVGMCQIGAAVMSQQGFTENEILTHYFNGAKIEVIFR